MFLYLKLTVQKHAIAQGIFLFHSDMLPGLAIEIDCPQFAECLFILVFGAEQRVANPEGQWAGRVVGTLEETFVVRRSGLEAREVDLLQVLFDLREVGVHRHVGGERAGEAVFQIEPGA